MTIRELIAEAGKYPWLLGGVFSALPILAQLLGVLHGAGRGGTAPWKYFYSVLVYLACVPGMFSSVLTAYAVFFRNENMLDVNLLVYVLPLVSMVVTLILVRRNVSFDAVPGFERLSGLMIMIACSFALALALHKTRLFIGFFGSIDRLFLLAGGIFALLKWGAYMLFRRPNDPVKERPSFPTGRPE